MTTLAQSRRGLFAETETGFATNSLSRLRRTLSDTLLYRRTLAELRALNARQRDDLGFTGRDLAAIAHRAVYA